jgi:hypothetical protein
MLVSKFRTLDLLLKTLLVSLSLPIELPTWDLYNHVFAVIVFLHLFTLIVFLLVLTYFFFCIVLLKMMSLSVKSKNKGGIYFLNFSMLDYVAPVHKKKDRVIP